MPVKIEVSGDDARHAQREMLDLLRGTAAYNKDVEGHLRYAQNAWLIPDFPISRLAEQGFVPHSDEPIVDAGPSEKLPPEAASPTRERGQPSPGKARRTKAEIAEDEAADKADAGNIVDESGETSGMSIATGEERISPEDEADAAVDAADEAAETQATGGLVPRERLRKALGALGIKAGVEAVKPGGLLGMAVQDVPEDQIEAAIAKLEAGKNRGLLITAQTGVVAEEIELVPDAKPATKDELMAAMLDYAEIFDGTRDPKKAVLASEDCGKVFKLIFGDEVASMSKVPADQYYKAIAGIREAINKNPYDRERKG